MSRLKNVLVSAAAVTLLAGPLEAVVVPSRTQEKEFRSPGLAIPTQHTALSALDAKQAAGLQTELAGLGVPPEGAFYDPLWQRWGSLLPSVPLVPGRGVGNTLSWANFGVAGQPTDTQIKAAAWEALTGYLRDAPELRVDVGELGSPSIGIFAGGTLIHVHAQRVVGGIAVRDSGLSAVINHGNLILLGLQNWGSVDGTTNAVLSADAARAVVEAHVKPSPSWGTTRRAWRGCRWPAARTFPDVPRRRLRVPAGVGRPRHRAGRPRHLGRPRGRGQRRAASPSRTRTSTPRAR